VEKRPRLQNVCVSLEHDVLLIMISSGCLGTLDRSSVVILRRLAVNLGGLFGWLSPSDLYMQFTQLRYLNLFDGGEDPKIASFKVDEIDKVLMKAQKVHNEKQGSKKKYVAPVVRHEKIPTAVQWQSSADESITFKYPKGYKAPVVRHRRGCPRHADVSTELRTLTSVPEVSSRFTAPP
jgi:hypothetical protein